MALQIRTSAEWTSFFTDAGIPATESAAYAETFSTSRMTELSLPVLDKATLVDIGITVLGDQLAILSRAKLKSAGAPNQDVRPKPKPPPAKLPTIEPNMTSPQFRKFLVDWRVYKNLSSIPAD